MIGEILKYSGSTHCCETLRPVLTYPHFLFTFLMPLIQGLLIKTFFDYFSDSTQETESCFRRTQHLHYTPDRNAKKVGKEKHE